MISVIKVEEDTRLENLIDPASNERFDFVMCNPPFYENESEATGNSDHIRNREKRPKPHSVNTGRIHESVYSDGGEVGFVKKIIDESLILRDRIKQEINLIFSQCF